MKRNALFPYLLIGVFGIGLVIALSLIGLYQGNEEAGGEEGGNVELATPEDIYNQSCISCHGGNYEGGAGPELVGVDTRLSQEKVKEVLQNGKGIMPSNLVAEESLDEMVDWIMSLE